MRAEVDSYQNFIQGYNLIMQSDFNVKGTSKLVVLTRDDLVYKILNDKMEPDIASIWLAIQRKGKKPFILGAFYREHHLLMGHNNGQENLTADPRLQKNRLNKFLVQWSEVDLRSDIMIAGDLNLDHQKWSHPEPGQEHMVADMKDRIETLGFSQMVRGPTRHWKNTTPSLLDHVWLNMPQIWYIAKISLDLWRTIILLRLLSD